MTLNVLIEHWPEGHFTATLLGWPNFTAQGRTEEEAVALLRQAFTARLAHARIIPLDLNGDGNANPWLQLAGVFRDDPFAAEMEEAIAAYRHELDAQDGGA